MFFVCLKKKEWFAHSLFCNERCEQINQVAHQKWANEQIAHFFERIKNQTPTAQDIVKYVGTNTNYEEKLSHHFR